VAHDTTGAVRDGTRTFTPDLSGWAGNNGDLLITVTRIHNQAGLAYTVRDTATLAPLVNPDFWKSTMVAFNMDAWGAGSADTLARHSVIICSRFYFDDIGGDSWAALKAVNPFLKIYIYENSYITDLDDDDLPLYRDTIARWADSEGHSMGALDTDNPHLFALDADSNRITTSANSWLPELTSADWVPYIGEATHTDVGPYVVGANGYYYDNSGYYRNRGISTVPATMSTLAIYAAVAVEKNQLLVAWNKQNYGLETAFNCGALGDEHVRSAWLAIEASDNPPAVAVEETFAATKYTEAYDVNFASYGEWFGQVSTIAQIGNTFVVLLSHCKLNPGESGIDERGAPVSFADIRWFVMTSYAQCKSENTALLFAGVDRYKDSWRYPEFSAPALDLGPPLGDMQTLVSGSATLHYRVFRDGIALVNPSYFHAASVDLTLLGSAEGYRVLDDSNFDDPENVQPVTSISLDRKRGRILLPPLPVEAGDPVLYVATNGGSYTLADAVPTDPDTITVQGVDYIHDDIQVIDGAGVFAYSTISPASPLTSSSSTMSVYVDSDTAGRFLETNGLDRMGLFGWSTLPDSLGAASAVDSAKVALRVGRLAGGIDEADTLLVCAFDGDTALGAWDQSVADNAAYSYSAVAKATAWPWALDQLGSFGALGVPAKIEPPYDGAFAVLDISESTRAARADLKGVAVGADLDSTSDGLYVSHHAHSTTGNRPLYMVWARR